MAKKEGILLKPAQNFADIINRSIAGMMDEQSLSNVYS